MFLKNIEEIKIISASETNNTFFSIKIKIERKQPPKIKKCIKGFPPGPHFATGWVMENNKKVMTMLIMTLLKEGLLPNFKHSAKVTIKDDKSDTACKLSIGILTSYFCILQWQITCLYPNNSHMFPLDNHYSFILINNIQQKKEKSKNFRKGDYAITSVLSVRYIYGRQQSGQITPYSHILEELW